MENPRACEHFEASSDTSINCFSHLLQIAAARRFIKISVFRLVLNVISEALALSRRGCQDVLAFLLEDQVPATPLNVSYFSLQI